MKAEHFLKEAIKVQEARGEEYDKDGQERSMAKVIKVFNAFHDTNLTESQGWHFMSILKDVRLFGAKEFHYDSALDGVSYTALLAESKASEGGEDE